MSPLSIYEQFANKRNGGAEKRSFRNVMAKVNRKLKLKGKEKISSGALQRFTIYKYNKPRKTLIRSLLTAKLWKKEKNLLIIL